MDADLRRSRRPLADAQLRGDAGGRDGGVREELAVQVNGRPASSLAAGQQSSAARARPTNGSGLF